MERTKGALTLLLQLITLALGGRARPRSRPAGGDGRTAREVLNQPPRPVRGDDGTPNW